MVHEQLLLKYVYNRKHGYSCTTHNPITVYVSLQHIDEKWFL